MICTAVAFGVFFRLIAEVGPARATVITYVNPAVAVALGVIVLGEHVTPAIGAAFILYPRRRSPGHPRGFSQERAVPRGARGGGGWCYQVRSD